MPKESTECPPGKRLCLDTLAAENVARARSANTRSLSVLAIHHAYAGYGRAHGAAGSKQHQVDRPAQRGVTNYLAADGTREPDESVEEQGDRAKQHLGGRARGRLPKSCCGQVLVDGVMVEVVVVMVVPTCWSSVHVTATHLQLFPILLFLFMTEIDQKSRNLSLS